MRNPILIVALLAAAVLADPESSSDTYRGVDPSYTGPSWDPSKVPNFATTAPNTAPPGIPSLTLIPSETPSPSAIPTSEELTESTAIVTTQSESASSPVETSSSATGSVTASTSSRIVTRTTTTPVGSGSPTTALPAETSGAAGGIRGAVGVVLAVGLGVVVGV